MAQSGTVSKEPWCSESTSASGSSRHWSMSLAEQTLTRFVAEYNTKHTISDTQKLETGSGRKGEASWPSLPNGNQQSIPSEGGHSHSLEVQGCSPLPGSYLNIADTKPPSQTSRNTWHTQLCKDGSHHIHPWLPRMLESRGSESAGLLL